MEACHFSKPLQVQGATPSAGKIMCTVFWDAEGVLIDYMPHKEMITGVYYADLLRQLCIIVEEKRRVVVLCGLSQGFII
jgi:hypothetical protein